MAKNLRRSLHWKRAPKEDIGLGARLFPIVSSVNNSLSHQVVPESVVFDAASTKRAEVENETARAQYFAVKSVLTR